MRIEGLEHIPDRGPCLVVSNHVSWLDPPVLGCSVPHRQMHFMAKRELFEHRVLGRLISWLGSFPVDRGQADRKSLRMALDLLGSGRIVCIFPEGTRGSGGEMQPWHIGMAMIANHAQVPIVPAAVKHTRDLLEDRHRETPRRPIWVRFGPPLRPTELSTHGGKARLAAIQEQSSAAVRELLAEMRERN